MENIFVEFLPPWVETGLQPAFYDKESGTVLQQTARMYDRVNMLIRMFNKLSKETKETVENYIQEFDNLYTYVHDYFDNLDVQEEINNKLDAMADDGTLQEIVASYLNAKAVFAFDNLSSMKSAENLIDGSYARTLGYYSKNDGGEALYKIREITNDDVVDEKFIIEMDDDTLIAELITDGKKVNINQVGGSGNHISAVANYLIGEGYDIYIPRGDYTLTSTIVVNTPKTKIICDGNLTASDLTTYFLVNSNNNIIELNGEVTGYDTGGSHIPTLIKFGDDTANAWYNKLFIKNASGFDKAIYLGPDNYHGVAYNNIKFDYIEATTGILFKTGDGVRSFVNENYFEGGQLASIYGIIFEKGLNQNDPYNGNVFDHIGIETDGIVKAIDLNFASFNNFNDMRISEGLTGSVDPIHIGDGCRDNIIQTKYQLKTSQITDENTQNYIRNYFDTCLADTSLNRIGRNFYMYKGAIILNDNNSYVNEVPVIANTTDTNEDSTEQLVAGEYLLNNGEVIKLTVSYGSVNKVFKLPKGFDVHSINSFVLLIPYKENGSTITLQDYDGHTILSSTQIGTAKIQKKKYLVKYTSKAGVATGVYEWTFTDISA